MLRTTAVILAACIAAAAVGACVVYMMAGGGPGEEAGNEYLGMQAKYNVSDGMALITVVSGTVEIKVVDEKKELGRTYIRIECVYDIKAGADRYKDTVTTDFFEVGGGGTLTSALSGAVSTKAIGTERNMRVNVNGESYRVDTTKYSAEVMEQSAVIWVGDKDDMVYKAEATLSGTWLPQEFISLFGIKLIFTLDSTNII